MILFFGDPESKVFALETNDKVRKNRDWEEMKGRAVVDE